MGVDYGRLVRRRREMLGLSQRALARRAGVAQPLIAVIERNHRQPSGRTRAALDEALAVKPSVALEACADHVREVFTRFGLEAPRVFGSVARKDDDESSDLDLLVDFTDSHDIVDLLALEDELTDLLTVKVEIVDARGESAVLDRAREEAVAL
ncbi:helix-turn-helix domain-containing protein [Sediminivirga luteola]|nr:helix-turn-helix domain-containing protein [Sediminivirga luteola]